MGCKKYIRYCNSHHHHTFPSINKYQPYRIVIHDADSKCNISYHHIIINTTTALLRGDYNQPEDSDFFHRIEYYSYCISTTFFPL